MLLALGAGRPALATPPSVPSRSLTASHVPEGTSRLTRQVKSTYRGYTVYGMPPPSSGGPTLALMLNILEGPSESVRVRPSP